ncbi:MAG: zinc ribbon domain-containing protein [Planctomycetota bacterium]
MSATESVSTVACGACEQTNPASAQFCASCGHALYEQCDKCNTPVTLTQKFCVSCGRDLASWLEDRQASKQQRLAEAVAAVKVVEFDRATTILNRLVDEKDYRFGEIASRAREAREKVALLQEQIQTDAAEKIAQAKVAYANDDRGTAAKLLSKVHERLLDEESTGILQASRSFLEQSDALQKDLQECWDRKDYRTAAGILQQLTDLMPGHEKYRKLALQVSEKLSSRARKLATRFDYEAAADVLSSVPLVGQNEDVQLFRREVDRLVWFQKAFISEPFATPALGRLAIRYAKEAPNDGSASAMVDKLKSAVREPRAAARDWAPHFDGTRKSWLGAPFSVLGRLTAFDLSGLDDAPQSWSGYGVAIGLALQAIGLSRVEGNLVPSKGVLGKLGFGKANAAWGVDIGSSMLRAVLLSFNKGDEQPKIEVAFEYEFETPTCRGGGLTVDADVIRPGIEKLLEVIDESTEPIWCNLSASDSVSRFSELPPIKDKQADALIAKEVDLKIPIPEDELALISWRAKFDKQKEGGRPLMLSATKKINVTRRTDLLGASGLKIAGMQMDQVALINFIDFGFGDVLRPESETGGEAQDDADNDNESVESDDPPRKSHSMAKRTHCVAVLDTGAAKTTLALVTPTAIWYWTQETGGEDVTALIARTTKLAAADAEKSKRNFASFDWPNEVDEAVAKKQDELKERVKRLREEAEKTFGEFEIDGVWCVGGAYQQHGFLRRVLSR